MSNDPWLERWLPLIAERSTAKYVKPKVGWGRVAECVTS